MYKLVCVVKNTSEQHAHLKSVMLMYGFDIKMHPLFCFIFSHNTWNVAYVVWITKKIKIEHANTPATHAVFKEF